MAGGDARPRQVLGASGRLVLPGVAALAFGVRLLPVLLGGGLGSYGRYDDGVYYAASDALTFGRVPYRDFVLLHPPGITLLLTPFALLGRLTSDPVGMAVARVAFMGIGALNAVLVTILARRWGRAAALISGVLYACWAPAVYGEQSTLLEPLGTTALLVALLLLLKATTRPAVRAEVLAGVVLGLAVALKIWYVVPWGVVVAWQLMARRWSTALRLLVGGAGALFVVIAPFVILAPGRMFDMVLRDQLVRHQAASSRTGRIPSILGVKPLLPHHVEVLVVTGAALALLAAAAIVCWLDREARVLVALLVAHVTVLLLSPAYFAHYGALTAAPAALVLGVAVGRFAAVPLPRPLPVLAMSIALLACLGSGIRVATTAQGRVFPGRQFADAAPAGCVASDEPQALIQMNRLSRDLQSGCRIPVDVTGITYDALRRVGPQGHAIPRGRNRAWQQFLYSYLVSARSFVVARARGDAMAPDIASRLALRPVLAHSHGLTLRSGNAGP